MGNTGPDSYRVILLLLRIRARPPEKLSKPRSLIALTLNPVKSFAAEQPDLLISMGRNEA